MKMILLCVLFLGTLNLYAQEQKEDVQNLPVLQEWYSWKGARAAKISYLPNFYGKGGQHAITQKRDGKSTWFNRFPFDTTNQFTWKDSYFVAQGDFNNDGFHDYWCAGCYVYKGYAKDSMPEKEPVQQYNVLGADPYVMDINNDGYDDILMINNTGRTLVSCVFGQKELATMKVTTVPTFWTNDEFKLAHTVGVYTNEEKKPRIIIYTLRDYFEGFYLYGIRTENKGDSVHVFLDELDKIEISKLYKDEPQKLLPSETLLYQHSSLEGILFKHYFAQPVQGVLLSNSYLIVKDKFRDEKKDIPGTIALSGSFDGDTIPDIGEVTSITEDNVRKWYVLLFSGSTLSSQTPRCRFEVPRGTLGRSLKFVGDVNGDGLGDLAYGSQGCFSIYLGLNWRTVGTTTEYTNPSFIIQQNEPNPVSKDRQSVLPISLKKAGIYALHLYDIRGAKIKTLFEGFLNSGEVKLPLDLIGLSVGTYILKMTDGKQVRERAIIISE